MATTELDQSAEIEDEYTGDLTPRVQVLNAIFSIAASHDSVCQEFHHDAETAMEKTLRGEPTEEPLSDTVGSETHAVTELCATIAEAALRRAAQLETLGQRIVSRGLIDELEGQRLEKFLRPIFEESGIGDRFEVRLWFKVYPTNVRD